MAAPSPTPIAASVLVGILVLLSGCSSPTDAGREDPLDGTPDVAGEERLEPIVFEGTIRGVLDCVALRLLQEPATAVTLDIPAEARGRPFTFSATGPDGQNHTGAICLQFDDGEHLSGGEVTSGRVPNDARIATLVASATVEATYKLTIE